MLCKKLHHAAFRCRDARETVEFYTNILGLKFSHAMGEDHVPSTGKYSPHVHIFFEMEDGSNIAFFECPKDDGEPSGRDPKTPGWVQHFAFEVESMDVLLKAKDELKAKGLDVVGPTNHDDFITSIYFFDPNGHRLELAFDTGTAAELAELKRVAPAMLEEWSRTKKAPQHAAWLHEKARAAHAAKARLGE